MSPTRAVIVTGSRRGLGRAMSEHLLESGYVVVGCGRGPEAGWSGEGYDYVQADVTDAADVARLVEAAVSAADELYGVVNNAATASMNHALLTPATSVADMMRSSVVGGLTVSEAAVDAMGDAGGRVIHLSSVAVPLRLEGQAGYVAAKAALEELTVEQAQAWAHRGVTVNTIGATPLDTDMTRGVPSETMERLVSRLPVSRLGEFRDVINVLDFFLDADSQAITGQVIYLGGVPSV